MTTTITSPTGGPTAGFAQAIAILTDADHDRLVNKVRLQGWRGDDLDRAVAAGAHAHRVGPLVCGSLALASALTGSIPLTLFTLATALVGIVAANHPAETVYNLWVRRRQGRPIPPNRAAKRFACFVGSLHLAGGAVALAAGAELVAVALLASLGVLALFVAASGVCIPSILYAGTFGVGRGTSARLFGRGATT